MVPILLSVYKSVPKFSIHWIQDPNSSKCPRCNNYVQSPLTKMKNAFAHINCQVCSYCLLGMENMVVVCPPKVDGFPTFAIHDPLGFTRWLWWFNSTQFIFSGCSKETRFPIPNYISIEVNDSTHDSFRAMANWSRFNSIQFIHELQCKMLQIHPFAHLPHHVHLN